MANDLTASRPTYRVAFALPAADLEVWEAESDYTADDPISGVALADQTTAMRVVATGTPTSTTPLEVETTWGGYPGSGAAFQWRPTTSPAALWRQLHGPAEWGSPVTVHLTASDEVAAMDAATLSDGRAVLAMVGSFVGERVTVTVEQPDGSWVPKMVGEWTVSSGGLADVAVVVLPGDGLAVFFEDAGTVKRFTSWDEGATWVHTPIVMSPGAPGPTGPGLGYRTGPPADGGGTYISSLAVAYGRGRMMMAVAHITGSPRQVFLYASEDLGHTWEQVGDTFDSETNSHLALYFTEEAGFLLAQDALIWRYADPFDPTYTEVLSYTSEGTLWEFFEQGEEVLLVEFAAGATDSRGKAKLHYSADGGLTWTASTSTRVGGLSQEALPAAAVCAGRNGGWLFEAAATAAHVIGRQLGGWTTLAAIREGPTEYGWRMCWVSLLGTTPVTSYQIDNGLTGEIAQSLAGVTVSTTSGAMDLDSTATAANHAFWEYTPASAQAFYIVEADVLVTAGRVDITVSSTTRRARLVVDADAGTVDVVRANTHTDYEAEVSVGSVALPSGWITVRLQVSLSGALVSGWVRPLGDAQWVEIAADEVTGNTSGAVTAGVRLRGRDQGSDLNASVMGWRLMDELVLAAVLDDTPTPAPWNGRGYHLQDGVSVQALAGGITSVGDSWTITPGATYTAQNLLTHLGGRIPSPRTRFQATDDTTQTLAFRTPPGESCPAHAVLVEATNVRDLQVYAYITDAWVDYGTVTLAQSIAAYTRLTTRTVVLGSATATTADRQPLVQDELVGGTFIDSADVAHEIIASSEGVLVTSGGYAGRRVVLTLGTAVASSGAGEVWWPHVTCILHHDADADILGVKVDLIPGTLTGDDVVGGKVRVGTCCVAPVTWLPENPDETRTEILDVQDELLEQPGGYAITSRTEPDRLRWEVQWTRVSPRYAATPGEHDYIRAMTGTPTTAPAATAWSTPEVIEGFLARAGRRPWIYLPSVDFYVGGTGEVQSLGSTFQRGYLVRFAGESFRKEGVLGHARTADQLVRTPTLTLVQVV